MAGKGQPKTGGRKKGTPNKSTKQFKEIMDGILFDDPAETSEKLIALRDSSEVAEKAIFWGLAKQRLPKVLEGKIKTENVVKIVDLTGSKAK